MRMDEKRIVLFFSLELNQYYNVEIVGGKKEMGEVENKLPQYV